MSVYKRGKNWRAEACVGNQRLSKGGFATKRDALEWRDQERNKMRSAPSGASATVAQDATFDELLAKYKAIHLPTIKVETANRYLVDIQYRIEAAFRYYKLSAIMPMHIEEFRSSLLKGDLTPKSINNCLDLLRSIFNKAVEWDMLKQSPFKLKGLKIPEQKYRWWDEKAYLMRFFQVAKGTPYEAAYRLGVECGLRLGEVVGLSKQDISFDLGTIHVHRQWLHKQGCYGSTKHNRERYINFDKTGPLAKILRAAVDASADNEIIFVTSTGKRIGARNLSNQRFKFLIKKAKVPEISFHDLRHTFASWYMIEHGDIWGLMGILGHSSIKTTMRYAHLSSKHQKVPTMSWGRETNGQETNVHQISTIRRSENL